MRSLIISLAIVLCVAIGIIIADTAGSWSSPGQRGTLTYTDLQLNSPTNVAIFAMRATALNVTNNQTLTPTAAIYELTGTGSTNSANNTLSFGTGAETNQLVVLTVTNGSTNNVHLVDSSPLFLSGNCTLGVNDTIMLWSASGSRWLELSRSNN
jgi:hypothetical protein